MKATDTVNKQWFLLLTILFLNSNLFGQKLPNKQNVSWFATYDFNNIASPQLENGFKALNRATGLFYTVANDNDNLIVMLRATDPIIIRKIIYGNISVSFAELKAKTANQIKITFPLLDRKDQGILGQLNNKEGKVYNDSLLNQINTSTLKKSKIKITGVPAVKDSLFQIDQLTDVKAWTRFDNVSSYTYALSIPIKDLMPILAGKDGFSYNVRLNGRFYNTNTTLTISPDGLTTTRSTPGFGSVAVKNTPENMSLDYPTDFSGEYILAKKP